MTLPTVEGINQSNRTENTEHENTRKQIEIIKACFQEAIEKEDYLTYFIKAYTLATCHSSSNYRLVNCLVHIVTLLIYHPKLPECRFQNFYCGGMRITQKDLDQYQSNQHILNRTFLSASYYYKVAEMFAGESQQCHMRYTYKEHHALKYSCLCQYLIKQTSTAISVEIIHIKRNSLDSTNQISVEMELEECKDPNNNNTNEFEKNCPSGSHKLSSASGDIKDVEDYQKFNLIFVFIFVVKINDTANKTTSTKGNDDDVNYPLSSGIAITDNYTSINVLDNH
ncbi:unnamed protein product [Rotaria magnacalcarata]|uniref:Uncharacterized protein n=2 Tax=Rotaria magnacalcarata TaxID=392030 RepID=A0A819CGF7_9BILA|nr:unnamed protein product [Rotaria magnacalcarata]CAF3807398.1 unnamed protein product [Rotaria magnacalcarata]